MHRARGDELLAKQVPTYAYEFADEKAPWFANAAKPSFPTGAYHAAELQYLFPGVYSSEQLSPQQRELSDQMIRYWARFAHTGNPNGPGMPNWPRFTESQNSVLALVTDKDKIKPVDFSEEHRCDFWDALGM